jgi:CheY-like chemotaxis protein
MEMSELNILCVDDDKQLRKELKDILSEFVNEVYIASDGKEAYKIFRQLKKNKTRLDILITDIVMPNMDGLRLIRHVKRTYSKLPCIVLSAFTNKNDIYRAIQQNILGFVEKPLEIKELLSVIRLALQVLNENHKIFNILKQHDYKDLVALDDSDVTELVSLSEDLEDFANSLLYYDSNDKDSYKIYFKQFQDFIVGCNNTFYLYINEDAKKYILSFSMAINKLYQFLYEIKIDDLCVINTNDLLDIIISITDDIVGYVNLILKEKYFVDSNYFIDSFLSDIQYLKMFFIQDDDSKSALDFF